MPDAHSRSSIAAYWIRNSVLASILASLASLAIYGMRHATGAADADAGLGAIAIFYVAVTSLWALWGAASGVLTGAVIQRVVPLLPARTWIALHAAMAVIVGVVSEMAVNTLSNEVSDPTGADDVPMEAMLLAAFILGAVIGAASGGFEALVLRQAALGTPIWIVCSMAALAIAMAVSGGGAVMLSETGSGFVRELMLQAVTFLGLVIAAPVMLPAIWRLRSRPLSTAADYFT
jgi:uncharacterized integral membrane protein